MSTCVDTPARAALTSSSAAELIHPSRTNAWSLTATLTGAVASCKSLSRSSMPPNSIPLLESDHSESSFCSASILVSISDFLSFSSEIRSLGRPFDSGIEMAWKSCSESIFWIESACSFRQNTATTAFFETSLLIWMAESPSEANAGRALLRDETVPTN